MANTDRTCSFEGCGMRSKAHGLCITHAGQLRRGKPLTPRRRYTDPSTPLAARMIERTVKTDHCWQWTGSVTNAGYGVLSIDGSKHLAHRLAYEAAYGRIGENLHVDHMCHNTLCVRPDHLQAVTRQLNQENRAGATTVCRSGVRGVHWHEQSRSWGVRVVHDRRTYSGGYFKSIADAEVAAISLRNQLHTNNLADRLQP